jgi:hypothetical protein
MTRTMSAIMPQATPRIRTVRITARVVTMVACTICARTGTSVTVTSDHGYGYGYGYGYLRDLAAEAERVIAARLVPDLIRIKGGDPPASSMTAASRWADGRRAAGRARPGDPRRAAAQAAHPPLQPAG